MKKIIGLLIIGLTVGMVSCQKGAISSIAPTTKTSSMDQLNVPSTFNWKTTQAINLTITAGDNNLVNVSSSKGVSYQKAFLQANKAYTMKLVIPAYEKTLTLNFMGKSVTLNITSDNMNYQF
ncbi:MAG: hypothetical protein IH595_09825 [Bacteroidales bacterium]|nr:hypothetical protein [Bacteroidales bacterium]